MAKTNERKTILIIGLGNPGGGYYHTRHSLGFMAVDRFAEKHSFPAFAMVESNTMASSGKFGDIDVVLAKPQTFMNKSGYSAKKMAKHYSLFKDKKFSNLWVINDDLDILTGKIKISQNRNAAGHKGVQSIIDQLKTKGFVRFRIGIQPTTEAGKKIPGDKLVLKVIPLKDRATFDKIVNDTVLAMETALGTGIEKAMTATNQ